MRNRLQGLLFAASGLILLAAPQQGCTRDRVDSVEEMDEFEEPMAYDPGERAMANVDAESREAMALPEPQERQPVLQKKPRARAASRAEARVERRLTQAPPPAPSALPAVPTSEEPIAGQDVPPSPTVVELSEEDQVTRPVVVEGEEPQVGLSPSSAVAENGDNSRANRTHNGRFGITADQQSNRKDDVEITRSIRRGLTKNKNLSVYARNVKIITKDGAVVLKGPVRSADEKKIIEDTAIQYAGAPNVLSEIVITAR